MKKSKLDENVRFFDRWAASYDHFVFGFWMRYVQRQVAKLIPKVSGKLLDVGCGTGYGLEAARKVVPGAELYGVDLSHNMLVKAKLRLPEASLRLANVEKLPYQANVFDVVFSTEALHHFPEPDKAVKEMVRVLKKGGLLIIADINFPPLFVTNVVGRLEPGFVKMYSKREMVRLFRLNGLNVLWQRRVGLFAILSVAKRNI